MENIFNLGAWKVLVGLSKEAKEKKKKEVPFKDVQRLHIEQLMMLVFGVKYNLVD